VGRGWGSGDSVLRHVGILPRPERQIRGAGPARRRLHADPPVFHFLRLVGSGSQSIRRQPPHADSLERNRGLRGRPGAAGSEGASGAGDEGHAKNRTEGSSKDDEQEYPRKKVIEYDAKVPDRNPKTADFRHAPGCPALFKHVE
jgi:hypothetical protein